MYLIVLAPCGSITCHSAANCVDPERSYCLCAPGYRGDGVRRYSKYFSISSFSFYVISDFDGRISLNFQGNATIELNPYQQEYFEVYLHIDSNGRSASGIRNNASSSKTFRTLELLQPIFYLLNSLLAANCKSTSQTSLSNWLNKNLDILDLYSLAGGLKQPLVVNFYFDVLGHGRLKATLRMQAENSVEGYEGAQIDGTIFLQIGLADQGKRFIDLQQSYRVRTPDSLPEIESGNGVVSVMDPATTRLKNYNFRYRVIGENKIEIAEQTVIMDALEFTGGPEILEIRWSAEASIDKEGINGDTSSSCLVTPLHPRVRDKIFYIKGHQRSYCNVDCQAENFDCHLFCVDEPILTSHEPGS
ncbi:unnamed protein product [Protopolystoma xenopodis]|uniref:EGF-like domain-containing protein n=1 Tax=Protopolystoma xenopodis TaxID=117903 RepID=A0A3S4ZQ69_9PLAT|nr:unnamed protein product [Protopolystoma xenopodis]